MTKINRFGGHGESTGHSLSDKAGHGGLKPGLEGFASGLKGSFPQLAGTQRNEQRLDLAFAQEFEKLQQEWGVKQPMPTGTQDPLPILEGMPTLERTGMQGEPPLIEPAPMQAVRTHGHVMQGEGKAQPLPQDLPLPRGSRERIDGLAPTMSPQVDLPRTEKAMEGGKGQSPRVMSVQEDGGRHHPVEQLVSGISPETDQKVRLPGERVEWMRGERMERFPGLEGDSPQHMMRGGESRPETAEGGETGARLEKESDIPWLDELAMLPVIAQSGPVGLTQFQPVAGTEPMQGQHPVVTQAEQIVRKLVERAELGPLPSMKEMSNVHLSLDRGIFGLSGVGLSVSEGSVAVVLMGVQNPGSEALAAAGQVLVRELQKHFPSRPIRILAREDDRESGEISSIQSEVEAPILGLAQREFTQGNRR